MQDLKEEEGKKEEFNMIDEDIGKINERIQENLRVLGNFTELKEEGFTRKDYIELLKKDLSKYYGYFPELIEKFLEFFSIPELVEFLEANEAPRPLTIRSNSLKVKKKRISTKINWKRNKFRPFSKMDKNWIKNI